MTLASGTRLGPYEILAAVGAGGMGEVYRARDTRLDRTVAVKVLSSRFSAGEEVRQRFEREAKTISSLSHPHICALFDVGNQDGVEYLVMEFLEGETLASRLVRGPMPLEALVRTGTEIAEALDAAHRRGIVHRDLKPGNVMLTKSGVKLVDFGLAKLGSAGSPGASSGASILATATGGDLADLTAEGTILGTFQYMAPEQLEGKPADARTDIFAFGAVVYEMATGRKAFEGKSQASLIAAILEREPPPISSVQPASPPGLDRLVQACLAKEPDERWQTAHDVALHLRWALEAGSFPSVPARPSRRRAVRETLAWAAAGLAGIVALAAMLSHRPGAPGESVRASLALPVNAAYRGIAVPEISPDGRNVVFSAAGSDESQPLWVRSLGSDEARSIPGTEGATFAFWSPDGKTIGFFTGSRLRRVDLAGGAPATICETPDREPRGGTWNSEGTIVFAGARNGALSRVASSGGSPEPLTRLEPSRGEASHRWPVFLPDGRHFLYFATPNTGDGGRDSVLIGSLDGAAPRIVLKQTSNAAYASGRILFTRGSDLFAQRFDPDRGALLESPKRIVENVGVGFGVTRAMFSVSGTGTLVYLPALPMAPRELAWFDRSGRRASGFGDPALYFDARVSVDGRRVAYGVFDPAVDQGEIWQADSRGVGRSRITFGSAHPWTPLWSPDAERLLYLAWSNGRSDVVEKFIAGDKPERRFATGPAGEGDASLLDWSPDGRFVALQIWNPKAANNYDIEVLPMDGDPKLRPFLDSRADESDGRFSPDGKWFVYDSNESGRSEIYVQAFPGPGGKWQVSTDGGHSPRWPRKGLEIVYLTADERVAAIPVATSAAGGFRASAPTILFSLPSKSSLRGFCFDPDPEGKNFLISLPGAGERDTTVRLVMNGL